MGRIAVYSISFYLYISICAASLSKTGNHTAPKNNPIVKEPPKRDESEDESNDSGPVDDAGVVSRDWRVLQSGDVLTPPELLPLAKRLRAKVDTRQPGEGKGIISSAPSVESLADVLFQSFFMTDRRITRLSSEYQLTDFSRKYDIAGLDALQALALDGIGVSQNLKLVSVDGGRCYVDEFTKNGVVNNNMCYPNGPDPRKSIYNLLTKPVKNESMNENSIPHKRGKRDTAVPQSRINLMKKLQKNRVIVVNSERKHNNQLNKAAATEVKEEIKDINMERNYIATSKPVLEKAHLKGCRWRFECLNPRDLDTCRLKTFCPGKGEEGRTGADKNRERILQRVRRMIGISSVDEEVEKILEARALRLRPMSFKKSGLEGPAENLSQYFKKLLMKQGVAKKKEDEPNYMKLARSPIQ